MTALGEAEKGKQMGKVYPPNEERRKHECPIDNCGEVKNLVEKNVLLNDRIRNVGIISLSTLTVIVAVLLFMANRTLDIAQETAIETRVFLGEHNIAMQRDAALHATFMTQLEHQQEQLETVTAIQREVIQEVSILKNGRVR